uniref:Adhesion G protein-coupled receptor B2 n=1 Tax=Gopherus evgoodei TaxID=1825980 RepID=A0A8C4W9U0_9SAUR
MLPGQPGAKGELWEIPLFPSSRTPRCHMSCWILGWGMAGSPSACSALASGVLYGSFSLQDLFPTIATGCSWTLENPDPTKYSLYLKFNREEQVCTHFSPMVLPLDHYLANYTCGPQGDAGPPPRGQEDREEEGEARLELCQGASPITFLHFDKNFVQLCLAAEPEAAPRLLAPDALEFRFVEVLLINNNNSSQFTCGVLCRWFEECLRLGERGARRCSLTQAGCSCQAEVPPVSELACLRGAKWAQLERAAWHSVWGVCRAIGVGSFAGCIGGPCLGELWGPCLGGLWGTVFGRLIGCMEVGGALWVHYCVSPNHSPGCSWREGFRTVSSAGQLCIACVCVWRGVRCVLKEAGWPTRLSLSPPGDPAAEEWSQWSVCSLTCGQGSQVRTRSCVSSPYGTLCSGLLRETRICNNTATCPVHGLWEEWSPWSLCSVTCGRGARTRTRQCVAPQHGGKACEGPEVQTKPCNIAICPVEGQWLEWGSWSRCSVSCSNGTQQRTRKCSVSGHSWAECKGAHADARECTSPDCPTDGKWGPWNHWSLCSKTCDTGWQRRFRMCQGTGMQGYPCEGSGEEVKTCNEKKCPAYHEMCKDEYLMLMTWKKTAAGEIIYNKCPPNATGSASRRCLLNAHGVAYWGVPSFARCISHEYRYLHLSLREHLAKGQRMLAGEGMSQVVRSLLELMARRTYYSGDLLFSVEILRNVTDTFKRATYVPSSEDVQVPPASPCDELGTPHGPVREAEAPWKGSLLVVEDFIHLVGDALKAFQSSLVVTDNLVISIQREPVSAVSSDINFPMKGRRGMKDWARHSEDKLFIPKSVLSLSSSGKVGPGPLGRRAAGAAVSACLFHVITCVDPAPVPLRPSPPRTLCGLWVGSASEGLSRHRSRGAGGALCLIILNHSLSSPIPLIRDVGSGNWDTESCQTLETLPAHTKCLCSYLSTYAVLAQLPKELVGGTRSLQPASLCPPCRFIKSERSIILLNFCVSILASNVLILVGQSHMLSKGVCTMTAAFLHFFFLSSFCWVLTEAWQSYLAVIGRIRTRLVRKRFLCLGWGLPALVVAVSVGFTRTKGYGTASYCWLSLEGGLLYAFVGPAAVIVLGIAVELLRCPAPAGAHLDVGRARHDRPALHPLPGPLRRLQLGAGLRHHHRALLPTPRGGAPRSCPALPCPQSSRAQP